MLRSHRRKPASFIGWRKRAIHTHVTHALFYKYIFTNTDLKFSSKIQERIYRTRSPLRIKKYSFLFQRPVVSDRVFRHSFLKETTSHVVIMIFHPSKTNIAINWSLIRTRTGKIQLYRCVTVNTNSTFINYFRVILS